MLLRQALQAGQEGLVLEHASSGGNGRSMTNTVVRHPPGLTQSGCNFRMSPKGAYGSFEVFNRRNRQVPVRQDADVVR